VVKLLSHLWASVLVSTSSLGKRRLVAVKTPGKLLTTPGGRGICDDMPRTPFGSSLTVGISFGSLGCLGTRGILRCLDFIMWQDASCRGGSYLGERVWVCCLRTPCLVAEKCGKPLAEFQPLLNPCQRHVWDYGQVSTVSRSVSLHSILLFISYSFSFISVRPSTYSSSLYILRSWTPTLSFSFPPDSHPTLRSSFMSCALALDRSVSLSSVITM